MDCKDIMVVRSLLLSKKVQKNRKFKLNLLKLY